MAIYANMSSDETMSVQDLPEITSQQTQIQSMQDAWDFAISPPAYVEMDECHPNLDVTKRGDPDDRETENNMVVKVEYKGVTYRVDFAREGEDMMLLPRHLKKVVALEDIKKHVDRLEEEKAKEEREAEQLKKRAPDVANKMKQEGKLDSIRDRLRAKLMKLNPVKYGKQYA